jgi:fatty-acid desaturase
MPVNVSFGARLNPDIVTLPRHGVNRVTTLFIVLFHTGAVAALFFFSWKMVAITAFLYWMCTGLGISLGYHRLHTHRSYVVPRLLEYFFAVCGSLTLEGGPITWVATHRIHHSHSDKPGDPHSPRDGTFWSHIGWLIWGETMHNNTRAMAKFAPDLARYGFYVFLNNYHWTPLVAMTAICFALGGWPLFLWGVCVRVVFGWHATWLVNSATHLWGARRFETADDSRNNWMVALITFGEGWHNNHHAHPTSARHGLAWYEFDPSWITLKFLRAIGVAKSIRVAALPGREAEREAA